MARLLCIVVLSLVVAGLRAVPTGASELTVVFTFDYSFVVVGVIDTKRIYFHIYFQQIPIH